MIQVVRPQQNAKGKPVSSRDEQATMVEDCENRESKLSEWERTFIDSIKQQLAQGRTLTQKQTERLDEIWERIT